MLEICFITLVNTEKWRENFISQTTKYVPLENTKDANISTESFIF